MDEETEPLAEDVEKPSTPLEAYRSAIAVYRECRKELAECEIEIDVARITKDTAALRVALSQKNRLLNFVHDARARIQDAGVAVVRWRGMEVADKKEDKQEGLLRTIVNKILQA